MAEITAEHGKLVVRIEGSDRLRALRSRMEIPGTGGCLAVPRTGSAWGASADAPSTATGRGAGSVLPVAEPR
jgi:hypothetical protein